MGNLLSKMSQWFVQEQEILDQLAHDVATSDTVEDMVTAKQAYMVQDAKVEVIQEALRFVEFEKEENEQN